MNSHQRHATPRKAENKDEMEGQEKMKEKKGVEHILRKKMKK